MTSKVTEKGQVTIPKELRTRFGIRPGARMEFREEDGRIVLVKASIEDRLDQVYGILDLDQTTDEIMDELRGPVELP